MNNPLPKIGLISMAFVALATLTSCSEKEAEQSKSDRVRPEVVEEFVESTTQMPTTVVEGLESGLSLSERVENIRALPKDLSEPELDDLFRLLAGTTPAGTPESDWLVVANEILETLRRRENPGLQNRLALLATDPKAMDVVRDYAVQHYLLFQKTRLTDGVKRVLDDADGKSEILTSLEHDLRSILGSGDPAKHTLVGTGLMGLRILDRKSQDADLRASLKSMARVHAVPLVEQAQNGPLVANVIAAIQTTAQFRLPEGKEAIRMLALDADSGSTLRMNAIFGLRYYADPSDIEPLQELAIRQPRFKQVIRETIARIENPSAETLQ